MYLNCAKEKKNTDADFKAPQCSMIDFVTSKLHKQSYDTQHPFLSVLYLRWIVY